VLTTLPNWNSDDCAAYLRCCQRHFMERIKPLPSFPKCLRHPTINGLSRPLWKSADVINWHETYSRKAA